MLADYSSIQDAIDAASAGDTVVIAAGIYLESLVIDKAIHLVGPRDPRFTEEAMDFADEIAYALVIGTKDVAIDWSANGGSVRDLAVSLVPDSAEDSSLIRITSGNLHVKRCVLSDGAETAVDCTAGEVVIERCHVRNVNVGVSVVDGFANIQRTHIEGVEAVAVDIQPTGAVALTDSCSEGRTVIVGEVRAFEGNDLNVLFTCHSFPMTKNRVSSLVHLCGFNAVGEVAVSI